MSGDDPDPSGWRLYRELAERFAHLPPARRRNAAWRLAWSDTAIERLLEGDQPICSGPHSAVYTPALPAARIGTDGWYHLVRDDRIVCKPRSRETGPQRDGRVRHTAWPHRLDRLGPPSRGIRFTGRGALTTWLVALDSVEGLVDPLSVPPNLKCPAVLEWPPSLRGNRRTALERVRQSLVLRFGPRCSICAVTWATKIDHDHRTGVVRGYLCTDCNARVDRCDHADDCGFADYLSDPPARDLAIVHPEHATRMLSHKYERRAATFGALCDALEIAPDL